MKAETGQIEREGRRQRATVTVCLLITHHAVFGTLTLHVRGTQG